MARIGLGYDVHRLVEGRKLILGGIEIPYERGLLGHSDADVLLHAICDALLGAVGLGDIGEQFPDTDPRYKDACSMDLLVTVHDLVRGEGFGLVNLDTTIFAQKPKLSPHKARMAEKIAACLKVDPRRVSIKATTTEGLGAIGRGEGIAAMCVALVEQQTP